MSEYIVKWGELGQSETQPDRSVSYPALERKLNLAAARGLRLIAVVPTGGAFAFVFERQLGGRAAK